MIGIKKITSSTIAIIPCEVLSANCPGRIATPVIKSIPKIVNRITFDAFLTVTFVVR